MLSTHRQYVLTLGLVFAGERRAMHNRTLQLFKKGSKRSVPA